MDKQLVLELAEHITIVSILIIIPIFSPSILMLVWLELSLMAAISLVNPEQYLEELYSTLICVINVAIISICPELLTFLPFPFVYFVINTMMLAASIKAVSSLASFLYDMIDCDTQTQVNIGEIDQCTPYTQTVTNEDNSSKITGSLAQKKHYCLSCLVQDKEEVVIPNSSIKLNHNETTTLYNEKIEIYYGHGICIDCFDRYPNKTINPTTRQKETTWHVFKGDKYKTSKTIKDNQGACRPKTRNNTPYYSFYSFTNNGESSIEYLRVVTSNTTDLEISNNFRIEESIRAYI